MFQMGATGINQPTNQSVCLVRLKKARKNINHDSWYRAQDLNRSYPDYKPKASQNLVDVAIRCNTPVHIHLAVMDVESSL
jgi:hypothetical protein